MSSERNRAFEKVEVIFDLFEWDNDKCKENVRKHLIDFDDAIEIFEHPIARIRSDRHGEIRHVAVGLMARVVIAVVYTERQEICRIISARKARKYEYEAYYSALSGGP